MELAELSVRMLATGFVTLTAGGTAWAQPAPAGPPAVGIVEAIRRPITETRADRGDQSRQRLGSRHRISGRASVSLKAPSSKKATHFTRLSAAR